MILAVPAVAHSADSTRFARVEYVRMAHGWLASENKAGLTRLDGSRISQAKLYGSTEQGEFIDYNGANSQYEFGVDAESYLALGSRTALYGRVAYRNFTGRNMAGSYLLDPADAPFDIVEYTTENRGTKLLEEYTVMGSVAHAFAKWVSVGVGIDYHTANYSKRKDVRHTNFMMNMELSVGVKFRVCNGLEIGANYLYRRRNESITLSTYGTTDKSYSSLLSYGVLFGKREFFGDTGYTKENESKPLFDTYHGGAIQLSWHITPNIEWFNEIGYRTRDGYYGDPSPYTVVYANHNGNMLSYETRLTIDRAKNLHSISLGWERAAVYNRENLYRYYNESGGLNYIEYLGEVETGNRSNHSITLNYSARLGIERGIAKWQVKLLGEYNSRNTLANNYPDYRRQNIGWWRAKALVERNISHLRNIFTIRLGVGYGAGGGEPFTDGKYVASGGETLTRTLDDMLMCEYEYLTSHQMQAATGFGYARRIGNRGIIGFINANYSWRKAFATKHLGKAHRHRIEVSMGCYF